MENKPVTDSFTILVLSEELEDIFFDNHGQDGRTAPIDGEYRTYFYMNGVGYYKIFSVPHDGTEEDFVDNLLSILRAYDSMECIKGDMDDNALSTLDEIEWRVCEEKEFEEDRSKLIKALTDYKKGHKKIINGS